MDLIRKKKIPYPISNVLRNYLFEYEREKQMPIRYKDLLRFNSSIPLYDVQGKDTLWETVFFAQDDMAHIYDSLKLMYAFLKSGGDLSMMEHLNIERIDICSFGNSRPFRVRIINILNDNFDYFYIKNADASRIYGLELEHILSPYRISFCVDGDTLVEEHILGVPGDQFINEFVPREDLNFKRLAKEFVKFNERCLIRLLGDMRPSNYVTEVIQDFDETHYKIRAIDFDQQSYEGQKTVYMPQFFKQNYPIVKICTDYISAQVYKQYQKEERFMVTARAKQSRYRLKELLDAMSKFEISSQENFLRLQYELGAHYKTKDFENTSNMGDLVKISLRWIAKE